MRPRTTAPARESSRRPARPPAPRRTRSGHKCSYPPDPPDIPGSPALPALPAPIAEDQDGDVVGLRGAAGEVVHGREELFEHNVRLGAMPRAHGLEHAIAPELLVGDVPRLGDAVAAHHHEIARPR